MFDNLKIDAKFEGKVTCAFKNEVGNLANFYRERFHFKK